MATGAHTQPEPSAKGKDRTIEETPVPLGGWQQKPTTLWAFQAQRFRWRQSRGVHMVLEKHWYHAYEIYKFSYHLDSTIPRGSVTSLLLGIAILRGSVSFIRGLESKALDNSLPRYYFHKEVSTTNRLSIHVLKPTFKCGQSFERLRSCEISMDLHAWIAADKVVVQSWEYWRSLRTSLFSSLGCFKHPQNGKIKQTSWSTFSFWKLYFQHLCRLPFSSHIMRLL